MNIPIVIAGIDTEVGKTVVSAILTEALEGFYWKSVQCGLPEDTLWVQKRLSLQGRCYPPRFCFSTPCSPHLAAKKENIKIKAKDLVLPKNFSSPLIIEGTGGLLVPLNETETWVDAALSWKAHWILVHRHYLGSLNHFALTVEAMRRRRLPLLGVIFNGEADRKTENMLLRKAKSRSLGRLPWQPKLTPKIIQKIAEQWKPTLLQALGL